MAMALLMAASRYLVWKNFIDHDYPYNFVAVAYSAYILCFVETWFFS